MPSYGRYQAAEPPHALLCLHQHKGETLQTVDHEPKVGVLDQEDLFAQGIYVSEFIRGARNVDALGSCTANATTGALSNLLSREAFDGFVQGPSAHGVYDDVVAAEKAAIRFYHECTDQTGDPSQEWPPTDCGSAGPYIVSELKRLKLASGALIASGPQNLVSLLQGGCVLQGTPWFAAWEEPDAGGFIDGDGSISAIEAAVNSGVVGGHETVQSAIEKLTLFATGAVDIFNTVLRIRNSWSAAWGDHGSCRIHLSSLVAISGQCDFRRLQPVGG